MNKSDFALGDANIAIIGLGLMGGSIALSLKEQCHHLSALDIHLPTLELAQDLEIVHTASSDPVEILAEANLVILACPVPAIVDWINRLPDYIQHPCIVLDIGSSKRTIIAELETLPDNFDPLGGHSICGREQISLKNAERSMFLDAPFVFTPLSRTSANARSAALQISEILGAHPVWLDAETHDRLLASTSHLPYLLSSALILSTPEEAAPFIGPGFHSSTRLAATPSSMMLGVLQSNRENIIIALECLQEQLSEIKVSLLEENLGQLKSILDSSLDHYQSLIN